VLDWATPRSPGGQRYDLVIAADVLYEERNAESLVWLLDDVVAADGEALIADPGRLHAPAFFARAQAGGWSLERRSAAALPSGAIFQLRRQTQATG
jgi:hypothetical protein